MPLHAQVGIKYTYTLCTADMWCLHRASAIYLGPQHKECCYSGISAFHNCPSIKV